ncbi:MAG: DEAD/DEAH box helicase family protein [Firmicutes bacterium]|nr:DEAD/DEAH box helicase family protein [Bacillota bacterium]
MSLNDLHLNFKYRTDQNRLFQDFYNPCLLKSSRYDRAAGYFSSHSLKTLALGFENFLHRGGKIRIVANPHLSEEDFEAIEKGHLAKEDVIEQALLREIDISENTLEFDTLNVLAWLIYNNQLEIKIAFTDNNSLYHEKFGIFFDNEENRVAFSGSSNETAGGIRDNFEKIDVFKDDRDKIRIDDMINDFENLWLNKTKGLTVISVPLSIKRKLLNYKKEKPSLSKTFDISPRPYQLDAINALSQNNWHGILEMATGTGKTITSLLATKEYYKLNGRMFLVIFVPFTHLIEQWKNECLDFHYDQMTLCFGSKKSWFNRLESEIRDYKIGISDFHLVITTYKTAGTVDFLQLINSIDKQAVLIADECHYLGSGAFKSIKLDNFSSKIGLSATPDRWWDETGTSFIKRFFKGVVYQYTLEEAIVNGALTNYTYQPHITDLQEEELINYEKLTNRIAYLYAQDEIDRDLIERLNRERSLIIAKAENKVEKLMRILSGLKIDEISHSLVYCAPGQVNEITKQIANLGIRVHQFDSKVHTSDRQVILESFSEGTIQILVAIKCLDEGVDVPSTKTAYFLASTSNPREFVQRRGRILRKFPGKSFAEIHDFIVLPSNANERLFKTIATKELPRFAEFSSAAVNKYVAHSIVNPYLDLYDLNYLMEMKPWDVYKEFKESLIEDGD